jgi:hypothetical protein
MGTRVTSGSKDRVLVRQPINQALSPIPIRRFGKVLSALPAGARHGSSLAAPLSAEPTYAKLNKCRTS